MKQQPIFKSPGTLQTAKTVLYVRRESHVCSRGTGSFILKKLGGSNSVVECDLAKVEVAGSNPVSRSRFFASPVPARAFRQDMV